MQQISLFINPVKPKARSPRGELIDQFVEELNLERGTGYFKDKKWHKLTKLTFMAVRQKVEHLNDEDLRYLWSICRSSSNFSKVFFGSLKVK